jgi:hypothetical protein
MLYSALKLRNLDISSPDLAFQFGYLALMSISLDVQLLVVDIDVQAQRRGASSAAYRHTAFEVAYIEMSDDESSQVELHTMKLT